LKTISKDLSDNIFCRGTLPAEEEINFFNSLPDSRTFEGPDERFVCIGFEKDALEKQAEEFTAKRQNGLKGIYMFGGGLLLSLLSMLWLMYAAGRTRKNYGITLNKLDRIYLDIGFCLAAVLFGILIWAWSSVMNRWYQSFQDSPVFYIESIALLSAAYIVALVYFVSFSKRFKRNEILKHTLIGKLSAALIRLLKKFYEGIRKGLGAGPLAVKAAAFLLVYSIGGGLACLLVLYFVARSTDLILGVILAICVYILVTFIAFRFITSRLSGFIVLADGIKKVKNGMLTYKIPPCGSHTINSIADDINNISEGLSAAVENEMKSERMKVELITNVSHDLRTPLTSIITYTDLLSQENVTPEQAKEYIAILKDKSDKLKRSLPLA
jgi:hypothetical protein